MKLWMVAFTEKSTETDDLRPGFCAPWLNKTGFDLPSNCPMSKALHLLFPLMGPGRGFQQALIQQIHRFFLCLFLPLACLSESDPDAPLRAGWSTSS